MTPGIILTLNAGSSSIKFSLYEAADEPREIVDGQVENLGPNARLHIGLKGEQADIHELGIADHKIALKAILTRASDYLDGHSVLGVGHRVVHGGIDFSAPCLLTEETTEKLEALIPLAPLHQPHNLAAAAAARQAFPQAIQVACFDTAFHRGQPWVNDTFALPRVYYDRGVRRYGFHGLSYDYVTGELGRLEPELLQGKVAIAHLGNGASMCAVKNGRSIGSTMGFSALDGLPMGTRCGQIDPGLLLYLIESEGLSAHELSQILYRESGLKGLSGLTHDMRTLLQSDQLEAKEAIDYYVFRARREVGAMAAVMGGLDALVFCGGIGENAAPVRAMICENLEWLGIDIDASANRTNETEISRGQTRVMVIKTDEELVMARSVSAMLDL